MINKSDMRLSLASMDSFSERCFSVENRDASRLLKYHAHNLIFSNYAHGETISFSRNKISINKNNQLCARFIGRLNYYNFKYDEC